MKLVDENESPLSGGAAQPLRGGHDLAHLLDPGEDGRKRDERTPRTLAQKPGEGGLSGAGRTPENQGMKLAALPGEPERPALAQELVLAEDVADIRRADSIGEGSSRRRRARRVREEIHG
jgi:hypothetical protein